MKHQSGKKGHNASQGQKTASNESGEIRNEPRPNEGQQHRDEKPDSNQNQ